MYATKFKGPLFIFGAARSGTTYLRRLLNSLPGVNLLYETTILQTAYNIHLKENVLSDRVAFQNFINRVEARERKGTGPQANLFKQPKEFYDRLYGSFCEHKEFDIFCQDLLSSYIEPGQIWGNKLVDRNELKMLSNVFNDAKFIVIVRDVRSVAYSNCEFFGGDYLTTSMIWADTIRMILSILKSDVGGRVMYLRYEDLVMDTIESLKQMASFIEVEIPKDYSISEKAHTKSIEKWRNHLTPKQIWVIEEVCFNEMNYMGYKCEQAKLPRKVSRSRFLLSLFMSSIGRIRKRRGGLQGLFSYKTWIRYLKLHD